MPIRPENRARYPADWPAISRRIREREGNRCLWCKVPNGEVVLRSADGSIYILPAHGKTFDAATGELLGATRGSEFPDGKMVRIVLTVAHLDHGLDDHSDGNLAALCQRCHLRYDAGQHKASARETRRKRKAAGDLFPDDDAAAETRREVGR